MKIHVYITCLVLIFILAACTEQPKVMSYFPDGEDETTLHKVWPTPPQVARYRYAGQLQGESNFRIDEQYQASGVEDFFRLIVGLTSNTVQLRQLSRPQNGMVAPDGRIFVTDVGNQAIFVFDKNTGQLSVWENADQNSRFISPIDIAISITNEILVTDSQLGRVIRLDLSGNPVGSFGAEYLLRPTGLDIDIDTGNIYVSDTGAHDIKIFNFSGELIDTIGQRGDGLGEFNAPTYLSFGNEKLYVSDTLNARVQILTKDGEPIGSIGQRGLYIGNFSRPKGITTDSDGNVYVVESYYDHLLIFNADGEYLLPIGGTGAEIGSFFLPTGIWSDSQDRIYTADMLNGRIIIMQYLGE